jgi:hypothetical protein
MSDYQLLITTEDRWVPEEALKAGLAETFAGTRFGYDLVPRSAFRFSAFVPDPQPAAPDHVLQINLLDSGAMLTFDDAGLEKVAALTVWVLATFLVPPGAEVMLWYLDDSWTIGPGVSADEIVQRFSYGE